MKMCADYSGIRSLGNENNCTVQRYNRLLRKTNKKQQTRAAKKFYIDKRDTTTPHTMINLLTRLCQGKIICKPSTNFLLRCMKNYSMRIGHFLPKKTKIWYKTGTMDGIVSVVGIIKLPKKKGHIALALYTNKSVTHKRKREITMARIAKKLFDYFCSKERSKKNIKNQKSIST